MLFVELAVLLWTEQGITRRACMTAVHILFYISTLSTRVIISLSIKTLGEDPSSRV